MYSVVLWLTLIIYYCEMVLIHEIECCQNQTSSQRALIASHYIQMLDLIDKIWRLDVWLHSKELENKTNLYVLVNHIIEINGTYRISL